MHQIQFRLGRRPDLITGFNGPTSKGGERKGRGIGGEKKETAKGRGGEDREKEGRKRRRPPSVG